MDKMTVKECFNTKKICVFADAAKDQQLECLNAMLKRGVMNYNEETDQVELNVEVSVSYYGGGTGTEYREYSFPASTLMTEVEDHIYDDVIKYVQLMIDNYVLC